MAKFHITVFIWLRAEKRKEMSEFLTRDGFALGSYEFEVIPNLSTVSCATLVV